MREGKVQELERKLAEMEGDLEELRQMVTNAVLLEECMVDWVAADPTVLTAWGLPSPVRTALRVCVRASKERS